MPALANFVTGASSTLLRLFGYLFLRWVPGHHFVPAIYTLFAIYIASFTRSFLTTSPYEVISDELDVITKETVGLGFDTDEDDQSKKEEPEKVTEIEISEVILAPKSVQRLKTLIFGLPSPTSLFWTGLTLGINVLLVCLATDVIYRGPLLRGEHDLSFARVGFVSHDSAKILIREPKIQKLPVVASYRYAGPPLSSAYSQEEMPESPWSYLAQINELTADTDFTTMINIRHLNPDSRYQYSFSNNHTGFFTTAPKPGRLPKSRNNTFTFLFTSCIKTRFPYSPLMDTLSIPGLQILSNLIPKLQAQFMLFLGDFIYVDVPHRFGIDIETYRSEYRRVYASPDWTPASTELPWIHVIDDHEIANDWDGNTTGLYRAAVDPFTHYHLAANPDPVVRGETYMTFTQGPVSFFMLDTRRYRTPESKNATDPSKSMLGSHQLAALLKWLEKSPDSGVRWKVIASSVPFTKNWRFGDTDTWGTYLHERSLILDKAWRSSRAHGVGVVVISGDRHEFAATRFPDPETKDAYNQSPTDVLEFSVSPLNMFYLPIKTYKQTDDEDVEISYLPDGQNKFGAIEVSERNGKSVLKFKLFVSGKERWIYERIAPEKKR